MIVSGDVGGGGGACSPPLEGDETEELCPCSRVRLEATVHAAGHRHRPLFLNASHHHAHVADGHHHAGKERSKSQAETNRTRERGRGAQRAYMVGVRGEGYMSSLARGGGGIRTAGL